MRIGVDVGGTNTDAVLMAGDRLVAHAKRPTSADVTLGIEQALTALVASAGVTMGEVDAVMIGTTHFLNAVVAVQGLTPTAAIRFAVPSPRAIPPMGTWPEALSRALGPHRYICAGGHEYDGRAALPFDERMFLSIVDRIAAGGVRSVALTSVFSPMNAALEEQAAGLLEERVPGVTVCRSHEIGHIGLLRRENATILNACLIGMANWVFDGVSAMIARLGFTSPVYVSQNDGTVMDVDYARRFPIATFASGPSNSIRGAGLLSGRDECVVADIGGTTSDVGVLRHGFPRTSVDNVGVNGVYTNFRMPELRSLAVGGGSLLDLRADGEVVLADSVGRDLHRAAVVFGGTRPTLTDVAVAAGLAPHVGDAGLVADWDRGRCEDILADIHVRLAEAVNGVRTTIRRPPLVAVGGAGFLVPSRLPGISHVERPEHHAMANAVGAAMAQAGAEIDRVFQASADDLGTRLSNAEEEAAARAVAAGADPDSVRIISVNLQELGYFDNEVTRVRIRAVGDIQRARPQPEPV
ncbi:hydantoinase/oxoprolinase family protein [Amycolatopsis sp. NBC_01307]|uniref:hydantoinase/oxoprolinase family protein n=1 Tax=Amycolatopsis sp. NBC_01307 TaxID=2903561 RepID=UPI002E14640A|nr:hydantoinase/oxoprolinase family protein [Amycolatopsis sp. NBC_01307]